MTANDLAASYADWAVSKGLLPSHVRSQSALPSDIATLFIGIDQDNAATTLHRAEMSDIVSGDDRVIIFHSRRLIKRDESALPKSVNGISIEYRKTVAEAAINEAITGSRPGAGRISAVSKDRCNQGPGEIQIAPGPDAPQPASAGFFVPALELKSNFRLLTAQLSVAILCSRQANLARAKRERSKTTWHSRLHA